MLVPRVGIRVAAAPPVHEGLIGDIAFAVQGSRAAVVAFKLSDDAGIFLM